MSHYVLGKGDRVEVRGYAELFESEKAATDVFMCPECGERFTRAQLLDAVGDDTKCPECNTELVGPDDEDEKE
jgi:predicted RNA-binding Zn-ribbon protein involved in translation (DUF1610 family)